MKHIYLFGMLGLSVLLFTSCGGKEKEPEVQIQEPKQEVVKVDTIKEEPEPIVEEPEPTGPKVIRVGEGQWLYDIARKEYGNIYAWKKIYEANKDKISDPNMIYPNQELVLPE